MKTMFLGGSNCGVIYDGPYVDRLKVCKKLSPKVTSRKQVWVDQAPKPELYLLKEVRAGQNVCRYFFVSDNMKEDDFLNKASDNFNYGCDQYSLNI